MVKALGLPLLTDRFTGRPQSRGGVIGIEDIGPENVSAPRATVHAITNDCGIR
jgi:hypothetical protein